MHTHQPRRTSLQRTIRAGLAVAAVLAVTACLPGSDGTITSCRRDDGTIRVIDAEAGETCGSGEMTLDWNQRGPAGPAGPQGPSAVLDTAYAHGHGINPAALLNPLGVHATVDVAAGASVHVTATKVVGTISSNADPAVVDIWVCHRPAGADRSALVTVGDAHNVQLWTRGRIPVTLSAVLAGLPAGQHEVGLCSRTDHFSRWNDNNNGSVTAMVLAGP